MKIAVAATGATSQSDVSMHSGRAAYFLIFDENGSLLESLPNPYAEAGHGAGRRATAFLIDHGIHTLIGGHFGPHMRELLEAHGIRCIKGQGGAQDLVNDLDC